MRDQRGDALEPDLSVYHHSVGSIPGRSYCLGRPACTVSLQQLHREGIGLRNGVNDLTEDILNDNASTVNGFGNFPIGQVKKVRRSFQKIDFSSTPMRRASSTNSPTHAPTLIYEERPSRTTLTMECGFETALNFFSFTKLFLCFPSRLFQFMGHESGAVIADILSYWSVFQDSFPNQAYLTTFGSPRPGDADYAANREAAVWEDFKRDSSSS